MGKTSLLEYAARSAADLQVVRIAGVQSESEFGFGALHRLLVRFTDHLPALPGRQREAISIAFGVADGRRPDRFLVGLAALTLLSDIAAEQPLLCMVDDAQWLDQESRDALGLIARRLFAEGIAMLFAVRVPDAVGPGDPPLLEDLPTINVSGLGEDAALRLITNLVSEPVDGAVARRIVEEAEGCPLAVREVVLGLRREQLSGHEALPDLLPIGAELERHFLGQVEVLPRDTQTALLLVATETSGDPSLLWRAGKSLGVDMSTLEPARSAGLLAASHEVAFRHPLIRSAVYGGARPADRRAAHLALAEAIDPMSHPDARAWHLASAASGPDEAIADLLVESALRARDRGRYGEEAASWTRAADLSPDSERAASWVLAAAQAHFVGGAADASRALLARASPHLTTTLLRAQSQRLEAELNSFSAPSGVPLLLLEASRSLEALDVRLSRETYAEALSACAVSAQETTGTTPRDIALAALDAPSCPDEEVIVADLLIEAFATRFAVGYTEAVPAYRRCVETLCSDGSGTAASRWAAFGSKAAEELWDPTGYGVMLRKMEQAQREHGALEPLRITLNRLADYAMWTGEFALADAYHSEAADITASLGEDPSGWVLIKAELLGWQGLGSAARAAADGVFRAANEAHAIGVAMNSALLGLAVLDIAGGRYADALASARQVFDADPLTHGNHCLREVIEAGVRAGDRDIASRALARLEERGEASGTPWALSLVARSRALMAEDSDAERLFHEAVDHIAATPVTTDLARTHLLFGEWLRRQGRRTDARSQLQRAHELFAAMGADAFAQRAARELGATGARVRRQQLAPSAQLTAQELRVARLAGTGATSKEIAAELFLSPRTIDAHLRSVFSKLGITSRRQLRKVQLP